jgi:hypothetical protein
MKLNWHDAPTRTEWGHDMVVATVALGKDHSVDLYCDRSKTVEAEALLHKPWVGLTDEEAQWLYDNCRTPSNLIEMVEAKLKEKNNG